MAAHLEVWRPGGPRVSSFESGPISIGRAIANDVVLAGDSTVSRMHALIESHPGGWCLRDLGSRNGTSVNGSRVTGERALQSGDELRIGDTRVLFRVDTPKAEAGTVQRATVQLPDLTRREREVLLALCRPLLAGRGLFTEPATVRDAARELGVTEAAVKQHLANLYDKFGFNEAATRRRVHLANEAISRGVITVAMLRRAES
jgi:pSer/pThr/pTyr-binding forkhead associated (FHA) protein